MGQDTRKVVSFLAELAGNLVLWSSSPGGVEMILDFSHELSHELPGK